jgi:hypothetical protein
MLSRFTSIFSFGEPSKVILNDGETISIPEIDTKKYISAKISDRISSLSPKLKSHMTRRININELKQYTSREFNNTIKDIVEKIPEECVSDYDIDEDINHYYTDQDKDDVVVYIGYDSSDSSDSSDSYDSYDSYDDEDEHVALCFGLDSCETDKDTVRNECLSINMNDTVDVSNYVTYEDNVVNVVNVCGNNIITNSIPQLIGNDHFVFGKPQNKLIHTIPSSGNTILPETEHTINSYFVDKNPRSSVEIEAITRIMKLTYNDVSYLDLDENTYIIGNDSFITNSGTIVFGQSINNKIFQSQGWTINETKSVSIGNISLVYVFITENIRKYDEESGDLIGTVNTDYEHVCFKYHEMFLMADYDSGSVIINDNEVIFDEFIHIVFNGSNVTVRDCQTSNYRIDVNQTIIEPITTYNNVGMFVSNIETVYEDFLSSM